MAAIVVTGAAGFVGHTLLPMLVQHGCEHLILVDRRPLDSKLESYLRAHASVTKLPPGQYPGPTTAVAGVICLAGATSVDAALHAPEAALTANLQIAIQLGEWARTTAPSVRIVYMSSDEVLGASSVPLPSEAPLRPIQPYAASKAAAELVLHNYRDVYGLNVATVRACNLVGAHQREPKLLPVAVHHLLRGDRVPVHGTGQQMREWMAVEDLCRALLMLLGSAFPATVYQAASGTHLPVLQVVDIVAEALGLDTQIVHVADRVIQDHCYAMDSSSLQKIGWKVEIPGVEAIREAAKSLAIAYARSKSDRRLSLV